MTPDYQDHPALGRRLEFYGASDDCFEIEGAREGEPDEINSDRVTVKIQAGDHALLVIGTYEQNGCWSFGVCQTDEDVPLPTWPIHLTTTGYSVHLIIDVPGHAIVSEVKR